MPLAVSMGEPAGIGPDVILQAYEQARGQPQGPSMLVFGDAALFASRAKRLGLEVTVESVSMPAPGQSLPAQPNSLQVVDVANLADQPGVLDPSTGEATVNAIKAGLDAVRSGICSGLVTAPIHKANLYRSGFTFPGHTEYLEDYARRHWPAEQAGKAVMMLAGPNLRTIPATVHIPLDEVAEALTTAQLVAIGTCAVADLKRRFGIAAPRLALAGLNPHAGEDGTLGHEDMQIIAPAVAALQADGIAASGPWPADTMFHPEARANYDVALCMYHDQALIPVKTLDFHNTVNVTLGLPFVRTSPDHGTALTLAGTGKASPTSLIAALAMAQNMASGVAQAA